MAAATPAPDLPTDRNPTSKSIKAFFNSARAPKKTTYDLTPFLSCPAVIARSKKDAYPGYAPEIKVLPIPQTAIPSPLAANLAPERIWSLKEFLCGKVTGDADGNGNANDGYGGNGGNERGKEIWLSWKRAWDLWNNHYIEGRVNPVWVAEEWKRREENEKNAKRDREMRRRTRRRGRTSGQRGGGAPDGDGEGSNLSFVGSDDEDVRCENGSDVVFMRGGSGILGRVAEVPDLDSEEEEVGRHGGRSMRRFDTGQEWGPLPPTAEGKKWIRTECLHTNDSGEDRFDEEWEEVDKLVVERTAPDITNAKTPSTSSASQSQIGSNGGRLEWRTMGSPPPLRGEKWRRTGNKRQQGSWESLEYEEVGESFVEPTGPASAPKPTTSAAPCSQVPVGDNGGKLLYQPTRPPRGLGTKWIFTGYTRMVLDYYKDPEWEMVTGDANATDSTNPSLPLDPPAAWGDQRGRHNGQLRLQNFMPVLTGPAKKWIQTDRKEEGGMRRREWEEIDESVVVIPQTAKEKTAEERMVKILAEQFKIGEELLKTTPKTVTGDTPAPDGDTPKSPRGSRLAWAKLSSPPNSLPGKKWEITYRTKTERGVRLIEFEEVDASSVLPPKPTTKSKFRTAFFTVGSSNDGGRLFPPPSPSPPPSDHSGADPRDLNPKTKHIGHSDDDDYDDYDDYDDDADIVVNHRTISRDGSSGGYYSIKDLADYRLPENDPMSDTYPDWQDVTSNSVWRPRRVGEKKLKIDLDEDIEEFFKNSDMEVWGGVDCGRSPYPVRFAISQFVCIR
jgi:hypothetical protein